MRKFPESQLRILSRVQCCVGGSGRLFSLGGASALLVQSVDRYFGDGKHLVHYSEFTPDIFRRCLSKVGGKVFGLVDPFTLIQYLICRLEPAKDDEWLIASPYFRRAVLAGKAEFEELSHIAKELMPLWYTIRLFVRNTGRVRSSSQTLEASGVDGVIYSDDQMPLRLEFFVLLLDDFSSNFKSWFPRSC